MKKIASFMVALLCVISLSVFLSSCGKPKPVSIGIKDNTLDTELFVGESLNLDDVVLIVTYDNKKTEEVAKNDDMQFSNVDTSVAGQKVLTITYLDLTTTITIIVSEPTAQSIAVKQGTLQTTVTQGLDLDLSNLTLVVSYNDGSVQEVAYSTQMQIAGFDNTQFGDQLITISYLGLTTTYEIEVVAPVVTGIEIKQGTIIDEIYQGKTLDLSNAVLIVSYNNNTKIEVEYNSDMIFKGVDVNNFGQQTLEVEYLGFSAQMTINVIELKETGITLIPGTLKTDLEADERLDTSTVKLLVTFNSGDTKEVTVSDGITFSEVDTSTPGAKQLTIYYKGLSISVAITVANPVAESIALKQGTLETTVTQGLDVDTSKVVIIVTYNTGDKIEVSDLSQIEFSNVDTSQIGKTTMTITYAGLQMQVEIDVVAPVLESIAIKDGTLKTQVYQEEQLDFSTVVLVLYYNNNTSDEVAYNSQMKFEGVDTASYGEQTLTITYLDKQVDVKINVIKLEVVDITVKEGTLAQTVFVNGTLDTTNVVLTVEYNSGKTEEVSAQSGKISFSTLDTSSAGEKTLNITYGDFSKSLTISVVEPMPTEISLVEGTLDTTIYEGEQLVLDNVKLEVVFEDESVKTIAKNDDMAFSKIDTSKAGQEILTITYKGVSVDVVITIKEKLPEYTVTSFELPEFATKFSTNAQAYNLKNNTYKVGDDNAFIFKPTIKGFQMVGSEMGEISQIDYIPSTFKVEQKSDGQYTELVGESLTNIVTIDEKKYAFDFDATAIGNTYKITISANTINGEESVNFEFEVVDGYNIQSKAELSVIDNNANTQDEWAELKQANNVPDVNPNAVVIHGSYVLTDEDVPSAYYYYKGDNDLGDRFDEVVGTLRNWKSIYSHDTPSGSTYTIYGNYNTIDASAIAITRCDIISKNTSDAQTSGHSALFGFGGDNNDHPTTMQGDVVVDSLNLVGNANRSEDELLVGGLLMVLTNSNDTLIKNCVASTWLTNMVAHASAETWENSTHILECNFSDSFSNMLYFYGIKNNYIENSNLVGSGGPLFTLTHVDASEKTSRWSNMEVKNSHLETHVTGSEAWFVLNKANETATSLFALDKIFSGTSQALVANGMLQNAKSFKDETETANFIGMVIADGDPFSNSIPLKGKMTFKDAEGNVEYVYDMEDPTFKALSDNILPAIGQIAPDQVEKLPFFNAGGIITTLQLGADYTPEGLSQDLSTPFVKEDESNRADVKKFFESDYLGLYINGIPTIGALVEFYNVDNQ